MQYSWSPVTGMVEGSRQFGVGVSIIAQHRELTAQATDGLLQVRHVVLIAVLLVALLVPLRTVSAARPPEGRWFWAQNVSGWVHLHCTRLAHTRHLDIYAQSSDHVTIRDARALAQSYERKILPTDLSLFGRPRHLGRVTVLLVPFNGLILGYFDPNDLSTGTGSNAQPYSNHGNVLYVRLPATIPGGNHEATAEEVMAHELQHLIDYRIRVLDNNDLPEPDWLNEGLSFFAQVANGYWTSRDAIKLHAALQTPQWPVTALYEHSSFLTHHARLAYGRAGTFVTYLVGRFGSVLAREIIASPTSGMLGLDQILRSRAHAGGLGVAFADWAVAQVLNGPGKYGYGRYAAHLHGNPTPAIPPVVKFPFDSSLGKSRLLSVLPWGQLFLRFTAQPHLHIRVRVDAGSPDVRVAAIAQDSNDLDRTLIAWLHPRRDGSLEFAPDSLGNTFNRLTLAISYPGNPVTGELPRPAAIRVRAWTSDFGSTDGPTFHRSRKRRSHGRRSSTTGTLARRARPSGELAE